MNFETLLFGTYWFTFGISVTSWRIDCSVNNYVMSLVNFALRCILCDINMIDRPAEDIWVISETLS